MEATLTKKNGRPSRTGARFLFIVIDDGTLGDAGLAEIKRYWQAMSNGDAMQFRVVRPKWSATGSYATDVWTRNLPQVEEWFDGLANGGVLSVIAPNGLPAVAREAMSYRSNKARFQLSVPVYGDGGRILRTVDEWC